MNKNGRKDVEPTDRRTGKRDRRALKSPHDFKVHEVTSDLEFIEALHIVLSHPEAAKKFYDGLAEQLMARNAEFAGDVVYIPKICSLDQKKVRNKKIKAKFTGDNIAELSVEFNLTERQIRNICCKK